MKYRCYDHRVKMLIHESGDPNLFPELGIPRSTAKNWVRHGVPDVVTLPELELNTSEMILENERLKRELEISESKQELSIYTFKLFGMQVQFNRIKNIEDRINFVDRIRKVSKTLTLKVCLELIGLSAVRFHRWAKEKLSCNSTDGKRCIRLAPNRLLDEEDRAIASIASDPKYFHMSVSSLANYAKRIEAVFASLTTWFKVMDKFKIKRIRQRVYPKPNKIGIRARRPGEIIHIDMSIIKLKDLSKVYLQSVVDNFSRYVLAFDVYENVSGARTADLLRSAINRAKQLGFDRKPSLISDSGCENVNANVKEITGLFKSHKLAQVDIQYSNSLVEAFFKKIKNSHLYYQTLNKIDDVYEQCRYFIEQHNDIIPLRVLEGGTPKEIFTGNWCEIHVNKIKFLSDECVKNRYQLNRTLACDQCIA